MLKTINKTHLEGYVYDHKLTLGEVKNTQSENFGKPFIRGTLNIATDEDGLNVVPITFKYVSPLTSKGNENETFKVLERIITGNQTWTAMGKDNALKIRIDTSLGVNDFYDRNNELVSPKINDGGFVHTISDFGNIRNKFTNDILITGTREKEEVVDENTGSIISPAKLVIKGAVFNDFKKELYPVELIAVDAAAMDYFASLGATDTNPVLTQVSGAILSQQIETTRVVESAFGAPQVTTSTRSVREWVVDWAKPELYDFGSEEIMTVADVNKMIADRQVKLAEEKKRTEDYRNSQGNAISSSSAPIAVNNANFKF